MKKWEVETVKNNMSPTILSLMYFILGAILVGYSAMLVLGTREILLSYLMVVVVIGGALLMHGSYILVEVIKPKVKDTSTLEFIEGQFVYMHDNQKVVFTQLDIKKYKVFNSKKETKVLLELKPDAVNMKTQEHVKELVFKLCNGYEDDFKNFMNAL